MKVAIIGAGLSGLIAANDLKDGGAEVTVFDKGRNIGGRCATRPTDFGHIDHGLQLLDGHDPRVRHILDRLSCPIEEIAFQKGAYQPIPAPGPYLQPIHGARSFAEALGAPLDTKTSQTATSCTNTHGKWSVVCGDAHFDGFDALILAIPPEQAAAFNLHDNTLAMESVTYSPQVAALVANDTPLDLPDTGPLDQDGLAWVSKSADAKRATILSAEPLSGALMDTDKDAIAKQLWERTGAQGTPKYLKGHRWRYCRVATPIGASHHWDDERRLGYCGDWFIGPNAGDALESGAALAQAILKN